MRGHDQLNDKVWSRSKVLGSFDVQRRIFKIHCVVQEDHGVSDRSLWLSFPASDRMGGR